MTKNSVQVFSDEAQIWIDRAEKSCDVILRTVKEGGQINILWNLINSVYNLSRESHKLGDCFAEIGSSAFHQAKKIQTERNAELGLKYPGSFADVAGEFIIDDDGFLRLEYKSSFENKSKKQIKRHLANIKYKQGGK